MSTPNNAAHGWARRFRRFFILGLGLTTAAVLAFLAFLYLIVIECRLSGDGNTSAVSATLGSVFSIVHVSRGNEKGEAELLGQILEGDFPGDYFGYSTSLSEDGNILAVGAPGFGNDQQGYVRVYYLENDNVHVMWKQLGQDITDNNGFGYSVALSRDGKTLAVGENYHTNGNNVKVYRINDAGLIWTQLGEDTDRDTSGYSTSLPVFANTLEVGCLRNNDNMTDSVYTYDDYAYANLLNA
jgi:hypothetical protein